MKRSFLLALFAGFFLLVLTSTPIMAVDGTWANDTDGTWDVAGYWVGGTSADIANGADGTAYFTRSISGSRDVMLTSNRVIGHMIFSDGGTYGDDWAIFPSTSQTLTLQTTTGLPSIDILTDASILCNIVGTQGFELTGHDSYARLVLNSNLSGLSGDINISVANLQLSSSTKFGSNTNLVLSNGADVLSYAPNLSFGGLSGTSSTTFRAFTAGSVTVGAGGQSSTFAGALWQTSDASPVTLIKAGAGTLTLGNTSSLNIWTGGTTVNGGVLSVSSQMNLGDADGTAGGVTLNGGSLRITGTSFTSTTLPLTVGDNGGGIDIADAANLFVVDQSLSGTGTLTKSGDGTLALRGDFGPTFTGDIDVVAGTLLAGIHDSLSNDTRVTLHTGTTLRIEEGEYWGSIAGAGGTLQLNATAGVGVDNTDSTFSGKITGSAEFHKVGTGTLTLTGENDHSGGTYLDGGTLAVSSDDNLGAVGAAVTFNGGTLQVSYPMASTDRPFILDGDGTIDLRTTFELTHALSGTGDLTITGDGKHMTLYGDNSGWTGDLTVTPTNTLEMAAGATLSYQTRVTLQAATYRSVLRLDDDLSIGSLAGGGNVNLFGYTLTVGLDGTSTSYSGSISDQSIEAGSLVVTGGGGITLTGSNSYRGSTTIDGATLAITGADERLPDTTNVDVMSNSAFYVDGITETIGGLGGSGTVGLYNGATLRVNQSATTMLNGDLKGDGTLVKLGSGSLALQGKFDKYDGDFVVEGGTLQLDIVGNHNDTTIQQGGTVALGSSFNFGSLSGDGTLDMGSNMASVSNTTDCRFDGNITGSSSFSKYNIGTLTLGDTSDYTGGTYVEDGVLVAAGNNALGTGPVYINGGRLLLADGAEIDNDVVNNGGVLGGTGTVHGSVSIMAGTMMSPGDSPGWFVVDGQYRQAADATLLMQIGGTLAGDEYDVLQIHDTVNQPIRFGGTLEVELIDEFLPECGDSFSIFRWDMGPGKSTFDEVELPELAGGLSWDTTSLYASGTLTVVPEPATITMLGVGVLGLLRRRKRVS